MRRSRLCAVLTLFGLLALATSAGAECAWALAHNVVEPRQTLPVLANSLRAEMVMVPGFTTLAGPVTRTLTSRSVAVIRRVSFHRTSSSGVCRQPASQNEQLDSSRGWSCRSPFNARRSGVGRGSLSIHLSNEMPRIDTSGVQRGRENETSDGKSYATACNSGVDWHA
jgi:hypothetical protein